MSTINTAITITHQATGLAFRASGSRAATDPGFSVESIAVGTSDIEVDVADYDNPRIIFLRWLGGDPVIVGLDGADYPFRIDHLSEPLVFRLNLEGRRETSQITAGADTAGSLSGDYLDLTDADGTVRVWFDVDGGSSPPATPGGGRLIEVDIATGAADTVVATALQVALDADASFTATRVGAVVTATDAKVGTRADVSAGTTGWSVSVTQQGAASQPIHLKSLGSSQVAVGIAPD